MLWVGQFGIADGEAREDTPWVGAYPETGRGDEASDLYMVVEPALPGSEEFCSELKEAIAESYHRLKVSLTGGLLRSMRAAHEHLRDWNRRSLKDHKVALGASCLVTAGRTAYLAQVGPASAVFLERGALRTIRPALPDALEPLGLYEEFWPDFSHLQMSDGASLLLLTTALREALSDDDLTAAMMLGPEEALPALYRFARPLPDCAALLVAGLPDPVPQPSA
jgi:hypothetical protein